MFTAACNYTLEVDEEDRDFRRSRRGGRSSDGDHRRPTFSTLENRGWRGKRPLPPLPPDHHHMHEMWDRPGGGGGGGGGGSLLGGRGGDGGGVGSSRRPVGGGRPRVGMKEEESGRCVSACVNFLFVCVCVCVCVPRN